jgi:hypothetical protein
MLFRRFVVLLLVAALTLTPSTAFAQCKWECIRGTEEPGGELFAACIEHTVGIHELNTCVEITRCVFAFCWPDCEGEWCYLV